MIEQYCKFEPVMISLRDYFAGQALIGLLSNPATIRELNVASASYEIADAMLEARKDGK